MSGGEQRTTLKRVLGLWDATAISVGGIIGAGIFVVTGIVAGLAGSALVASMIIAAAISAFTALSFAELTAWQPVEGSIYEHARQLVSPFSGFLVGWMWMLSSTFGGAAVSLGFGYYLTAIFPVLPSNLVAAFLCVAFTALNFVGVRQSALLNNILVAIKLIVLAFFIIFGALHANTANFVPFAPFNAGVLYGSYFMFFAYAGFARVTVAAEEVKDAKRNVPRAVLLSLAISTIIYILVGVVAVGLVKPADLASSSSPLTAAMSATGSPLAAEVISLGGLVSTASALLTSVLGASRMSYSMARRRDLPQALGKLHGRFSTPHYSIWILGALMALLVLFVDLTGIVAISTFTILFYYAIANAAAMRLKKEDRQYNRLVPLLGLASSLMLLVFILFISTQAWIVGIACLIAGAVYYGARKAFSKTK
jgi:APA family basic amino acid/polyamine antiporter